MCKKRRRRRMFPPNTKLNGYVNQFMIKQHADGGNRSVCERLREEGFTPNKILRLSAEFERLAAEPRPRAGTPGPATFLAMSMYLLFDGVIEV